MTQRIAFAVFIGLALASAGASNTSGQTTCENG